MIVVYHIDVNKCSLKYGCGNKNSNHHRNLCGSATLLTFLWLINELLSPCFVTFFSCDLGTSLSLLLGLLGTAESSSEHPLATAVLKFTQGTYSKNLISSAVTFLGKNVDLFACLPYPTISTLLFLCGSNAPSAVGRGESKFNFLYCIDRICLI